MAKIAALFVEETGPYAGLPDVDVWGISRDARTYAGPWPVVAHPPCERWGRYAHGGPSAPGRFKPGDDGGCFAAALAAVRRWGGVLEHPADSKAWAVNLINPPPWHGGWILADWWGGWTCRVDQGRYGHRARKPTWLYARGVRLPDLDWRHATGICELERLSKRQRKLTPEPFRDLLIGMARSAVRISGDP